MRTRVKICGLSRPEDIFQANQLKPDYVGFVFYPKSKRAVTLSQAALLKGMLDREIKAVGVFVNADIAFIEKLAMLRVIDLVQLHGDEDSLYIQELRQRVTLPIVKAIRVQGEESLRNLGHYDVDFFLFDTYKPGHYGGTGERFHLQVDKLRFGRPYFIAGGLDGSNVAEVIADNPNAFGVDVSGGVEDSATGLKDPQKMADFVAQVRQNS